MIERYYDEEIGKIWTENNKFDIFLKIEVLACQAFYKQKIISKKVYEHIKKNAKFSLKRIKTIEKRTNHDVIAFIESVSENVGKYSNYIHIGLTSSDILDTTLSIQCRDSLKVILKRVEKLSLVLLSFANKYKYTLMMGRTHGIFAEPTTLGIRFLLWYDELKRIEKRLSSSIEEVSVGKITGAVGIYSTLSPKIEEYVCKKLELKPSLISSQIISRDIYIGVISNLTQLINLIEKIALQIRLMSRDEVQELKEGFKKGQKGSSAMPHKQNPIGCERLCGLSRLERVYLFNELENNALWEERDISHSSNERIIIPDAFIISGFILNQVISIIKNIRVYPDNMINNLNKANNTCFSSKLLVSLLKHGVERKKAYKIIQEIAFESKKESKDFKGLVYNNSKLINILNKKELQKIFDISENLKYIDYIFNRVINLKS
jgi:adenylosuccinate lyase